MTDLPPLRSSDKLGREILSRGQFKKASRQNGSVPHSVFDGDPSADSLSLDRLDHVSDLEMTRIGTTNAELRSASSGAKRMFYGWAEISVAYASRRGRSVEATPQLGNPYHADVMLDEKYRNSTSINDRKDMMREHAQDLSLKAQFRPPQY